jgi:hypothetical protein
MTKEEAIAKVRKAMGDRECEIRGFYHQMGPVVEVSRAGRAFAIHLIDDAPEVWQSLIDDALKMYDQQDWTVTT